MHTIYEIRRGGRKSPGCGFKEGVILAVGLSLSRQCKLSRQRLHPSAVLLLLSLYEVRRVSLILYILTNGLY